MVTQKIRSTDRSFTFEEFRKKADLDLDVVGRIQEEINRLIKKSSIKIEPTGEVVQKQYKEKIYRMTTVVLSEPPAFISLKTNKQVHY